MKKNNQLLANPPIELVEYGDKKKIELTVLETEIFEKKFVYYKENRKFSKYLTLTYERDGERINSFVRAKNCAGILTLGEHIIKISPKIPNANYYGMLKYALKLGKVLKDPIPIKKDSDFWQYLVWFFLKSLDFLFVAIFIEFYWWICKQLVVFLHELFLLGKIIKEFFYFINFIWITNVIFI